LSPNFNNKVEKATMGKAITKTKPQPNFDLKEPSMYKVIYVNDDVTTVDFVIETLVKVFGHTDEIARDITEKIHTNGSGTAAVLPYEMAEQKGVEVTQMARSAGFPLQVKLEPAE